jgi:hypothetical protein
MYLLLQILEIFLERRVVPEGAIVYDRTRQNFPDPIPHLKLGKYVRFDLAKVQDWLAERTR